MRRFHIHRVVAWGLAACSKVVIAAGANASGLMTMSIEQLLDVQVAGASHYTQNISDAPAAVSVVTNDDIKLHGYRNLADILNAMRGLYLTYDRNYHYIGVRGFARAGDYNTRVLLLVDGVRYNDAVYDQASIGTDFSLDVELIERVEFIAGPGSSVYGANAFFGVVNVITKRGRDLPGMTFAVTGGSERLGKIRLTQGSSTAEGAEWLLSASRQTESGRNLHFPEFDQQGQPGIAHHLDYDQRTTLFGKWQQQGLNVSFAHSSRSKGIPTASFDQVFDDPRSHTVDQHTYANIEWRQDLSDTLGVIARANWAEYRYHGDYVIDNPPTVVNRDQTVTNWWTGELHFLSTGWQGHKLSFGGEIRRDARADQANFDLSPAWLYLDDHHRATNWGLYAQDEMEVGDNWLINVGLRCDHMTVSGNTCNPRTGLIWKARPETTLKWLYGTAYRAPNAFELYYALPLSGAGGYLRNPNLKPERIRSAEWVLEQNFSGSTRWLMSLYRNDVRDLISLSTRNGNLFYDNVSSAHAYGAETELQHTWRDGTRLRVSYAYQVAKDKASDERLVNAPTSLLKLHLSTPLPGNAQRLAVELIGNSARRTQAARLPGHLLANFNWTHGGLSKGVELSAGIFNLFNQSYADPASAEHRMDAIVQPGRQWRLGASYQF